MIKKFYFSLLALIISFSQLSATYSYNYESDHIAELGFLDNTSIFFKTSPDDKYFFVIELINGEISQNWIMGDHLHVHFLQKEGNYWMGYYEWFYEIINLDKGGTLTGHTLYQLDWE